MATTLERLWDLQQVEEQVFRVERTLSHMETREDIGEDQCKKARRKLNRLKRKRRKAAEDIDAGTLAQFDRLSGSYEGQAVASIGTDGSSYYCGGCFMSLTAEDANVLLQRDEIRTCNNCGRMLYIPDDDAAELQST